MRLLPSLREKKRYLAFGVLSESAIPRHDFIEELERSSQSLLGDAGSSECEMNLLLFDGTKGIVRCIPTQTMRTRAVLATIYDVRGARVAVYVIGISGTVKGAKRFF
ncbi:MAG: Rpp14/Pop5 family protein [Euryarchaeota archaeon]|nr:Rpp14/Pop5 family protein [Euryarchaeota archaeon]